MEDNYDDTQMSAGASMTLSPRIDANRLSLCQPRAVAEPGWGPVWVAISSGGGTVSAPHFDPEYAAFRTTLMTLARDGHRLLSQITENHLEADSGAVLGYLQRIDQLDEQAARHGLEPVRRWLHNLKRRVLATAADP